MCKCAQERSVFVSAIPLGERDGGGEAAAVANYVVVFSEMPELAEDEHEVRIF